MTEIMVINVDISQFIKEFETGCSKVKKEIFKKGETIATLSSDNNQFYILTSGTANLVKYDYDGNKIFAERFLKNSFFCSIFYQITTNTEFFVEAKERCEVLILPYQNFEEKCKANCSFHKIMQEYFPNLIISKINLLTTRIELLSMRTTREKLLAYLNLFSKQYGQSFTLPFSITELAAFLAVDRSSMSRELAKLKAEKLIKQDRNKITVLY